MWKSNNLKTTFILILGLVALIATGCKKKSEDNKILDGIPVDITQTVIPAEAAQQMLLLQRDSMQIIVPIINRLLRLTPSFPELTGPDGSSNFTFTLNEAHYGTANFTIQFLDSNNTVIDPISTIASSTTLKTVTITATGTSSLFNYSENLLLTLATAGDVNSEKRITGTISVNGSNYNLTFKFPDSGCVTNFEGLIDGTISVTGSGNGQTTTISLGYSTDHSANGTISWEGLTGTIRIDDSGRGFIITSKSRLIID